jgi:hypothetical protein
LVVLRVRGSSCVDAVYGPCLTCSAPTWGIAQELAWPRTGHSINGSTIADDSIPAVWMPRLKS